MDPVYDHGYIVDSAADTRLRLASEKLGGSVWLVRKVTDSDGITESILSCFTPGHESVRHVPLVIDIDTGGVGLHGRQLYSSFEDFISALQDPDASPPGPLGQLVDKNAIQLWKKTTPDTETDATGTSDDRQSQQYFKCPLCSFRDSAIDFFTRHLQEAHTEKERNIMRISVQRVALPKVSRLGATLRVNNADKIDLTGISAGGGSNSGLGFFLRVSYDGIPCRQSAIVYDDEPTWDYSVFVPVNDPTVWQVSDCVMKKIGIECWCIQVNGFEACCGSSSLDLSDFQLGESRQGVLTTSGQSTIVCSPIKLHYEIDLTREHPDVVDDQELGKTRNFTAAYERMKGEHRKKQQLKLANQLLNRLFKLSFEGPTGSARKAYEKTIVEWVKDSLVPKCPDCGTKFGLRTRRHHCRLCGGIVCQTCSRALDANESAALARETFLARNRQVSTDMGAPKSPEDVRACLNCCQLCEREHADSMNFKHIKETLEIIKNSVLTSESYYSVLKTGLQKVEADVAAYNEMAVRLTRFEGIDNHELATEMRQQIFKDFVTQDKLSKKLIISADGLFSTLFVQIHIGTVETLQRLACSMEDLPPLDLILSLRVQRKQMENDFLQQRSISSTDGVFELFEVQRIHPRIWFSGYALTESDWQPWSSKDGSWGYLSQSSVNPKSGFQWSGPWNQDLSLGDDDGWMYASKCSQIGSDWTPKYNPELHHVRRRRFYRRLEPIVVKVAPQPSPVANRRSRSFGQRSHSISKPKQENDNDSPTTVVQKSQTGIVQDNYNYQEKSEASEDDTDLPFPMVTKKSSKKRQSPSKLHPSEPAAAWIANDAVIKCMLCESKFTKLKRKHHCRHCGRVICGACSKERTAHEAFQEKKKDQKKGVRTCDQCVKFLMSGSSLTTVESAGNAVNPCDDLTQ